MSHMNKLRLAHENDHKDILEALESDWPVGMDDQLGAAIIIRALGREIERLRTDAERMSVITSRARNWQMTLAAYDGGDMPASDAWEAFQIVHALAATLMQEDK